MENQIEFLRVTRANYLRLLEGVTVDQLNTIPPGFKNNIIWNAGHAVITQQLLQYKLSGVNPMVGSDAIEFYRKGSSPHRRVEEAEIEQIKEWLSSTVDILERDYRAKHFGAYNEYTTSYGVTLRSIEDAISFNNVHEGLHLGTIMALRKLI